MTIFVYLQKLGWFLHGFWLCRLAEYIRTCHFHGRGAATVNVLMVSIELNISNAEHS